MKNLVNLFSKAALSMVVIGSLSAVANAACELRHPVRMPGADGEVLHKVKVDSAPKFYDGDALPTDSLLLDVFSVRLNEVTLQLGASLTDERLNESVGNANAYVGSNFAVEASSTTDARGFTTQILTLKSQIVDPAVERETHETTKIVSKDGWIYSIELIFPVYRTTTHSQMGTAVAFTGEHQTICVLDAQ